MTMPTPQQNPSHIFPSILPLPYSIRHMNRLPLYDTGTYAVGTCVSLGSASSMMGGYDRAAQLERARRMNGIPMSRPALAPRPPRPKTKEDYRREWEAEQMKKMRLMVSYDPALEQRR